MADHNHGPKTAIVTGASSGVGRDTATLLAEAGYGVVMAARDEAKLNAAVGLMEPTGNGIGGDLFAIIYDPKTGKLHGINGSGRSPAGQTLADLKAKLGGADSLPPVGPLPITCAAKRRRNRSRATSRSANSAGSNTPT